MHVLVGGYNEECKRAAYLYGTYVGQAFQLIDDALDFEGAYCVLDIMAYSVDVFTRCSCAD